MFARSVLTPWSERRFQNSTCEISPGGLGTELPLPLGHEWGLPGVATIAETGLHDVTCWHSLSAPCLQEGGAHHLLLKPLRETPAAHRRGLSGALG